MFCLTQTCEDDRPSRLYLQPAPQTPPPSQILFALECISYLWFDQRLKKALHEAIEKSKLSSTWTRFTSGGEYLPIEDAKEKCKDKPKHVWENILENSHRMIDPVSKEELILVAKYTLVEGTEESHLEERKRTISQDSNIKAMVVPKKKAKAKASPKPIEDGEQDLNGENTVKLVPVTDMAAAKMEKQMN